MWEKLKEFRRSRKRYIITAVLLAAFVSLMLYGRSVGVGRAKLVYNQSLDEVAASVNGTKLTFRDAAIYVALEEQQVERQAYEYDPADTSRYWNVHVDGIYIRVAARNAAIQMAVHDEIFYQMAQEEGIKLSGEEEDTLSSMYEDYWADLLADGKVELLGVSEEDIYNSMRKMAYAQKYQSIYAQLHGLDYEELDFGEAHYEELLKTQDYKIDKSIWGRVDIGNVTICREEQ